MKLAVVIGASSGIGQSAAIQIAQRAAGVILTYITNPARANEAVGASKTTGERPPLSRSTSAAARPFPDFVDQVTSEVTKLWQRITSTTSSTTPGFGPMAMFQDTTEEAL